MILKIVLFFWWLSLILAAGIFLIYLVWQNLVPSGYFRAEQDFCYNPASLWSRLFYQAQSSISLMYPDNRLNAPETDEKNRCFQRFFDEPVYFKIIMPRSFSRVKLKIFYQTENQPLLQVGLMKLRQNPDDWQFKLQPLENQYFDQLSWTKTTQGSITLWQKNKKFDSISQFVNNLPTNERLATFYYDLVPEAIKNPKKVIVWNHKTPMQYVDYVITQYQPPTAIDDLKGSEANFFLTPDFSNGRQVEFMFSAPDLLRRQGQVKIYRLEAEFFREGLTKERLQETLNNIIKRFIEKIQ